MRVLRMTRETDCLDELKFTFVRSGMTKPVVVNYETLAGWAPPLDLGFVEME